MIYSFCIDQWDSGNVHWPPHLESPNSHKVDDTHLSSVCPETFTGYPTVNVIGYISSFGPVVEVQAMYNWPPNLGPQNSHHEDDAALSLIHPKIFTGCPMAK